MSSGLSACYPDSYALGNIPTVFNKLYERLYYSLFAEWSKKVTSGGYDQRTQNFIRDVLSSQRD